MWIGGFGGEVLGGGRRCGCDGWDCCCRAYEDFSGESHGRDCVYGSCFVWVVGTRIGYSLRECFGLLCRKSRSQCSQLAVGRD
jgi:hypothetical protein